MKRVLLLNCLVLAIAMLFWRANTAHAASTQIMCLGDSITYGAGAEGGYRNRLYSNLNNAGVSFTFVGSATDNPSPLLTSAGQSKHEGHSGYTIQQIEGNLDADTGTAGNNGGYWLAGTSTRAAISPDIILLHIGTNNLVETPETLSNRLNSLMGHIFKDCPNTALVVAGIVPFPDPQYESVAIAYNALIPSLVDGYAKKGRKCYFVDMHSALNPTTDFGVNDKVHPIQSGYDKMADVWFHALQTNGLISTPEPSSLTMLYTLTGMAMLAVIWRRRKRKYCASPAY